MSKMPKENRKIFKDPVHGHVELHPLLVKMIDTPQFQRLRHIKQLGTKYLVFPGATHTCFAHSIGVAYLAECLLKHLQENQPELNINERDSLCVQIAALCHDMGHGPFSHLFDEMFIPEALPARKWQHEEASVQMFDWMIKDNKLEKLMETYGLNRNEDTAFIKELIKGCKTSDGQAKTGRPEDKSFLYEIITNELNGIDVDKWDSLARDCHYLGIPNGFDQQRLLKFARVCKVDGKNHICFRDKVAENIYGMFHTRYTLHRQALQHKIGYIIDIKMTDALMKANKGLKISDGIDDMEQYIKLTDHLFDQILNQSDSSLDLAEARGILEDIVNRRLPKFVGEAQLDDTQLIEPSAKQLQKELQRQWEEKLNQMNDQSLKAEDFHIYVLVMGFGEVGKDLIENVHLYNKNDPDKAFKMDKYQVSSLKPTKFHECLVRLYYNKTDQEVQQKAHECFHEWSRNNDLFKVSVGEENTSTSQTSTAIPQTSGQSTPESSEGEKVRMKSSFGKLFNDTVHGPIELHPLLVKIIDTPQFQRLRNIKQLGGVDLVYPGATHTRFEHSLGAAHLAGRLVKSLQEKELKDLDQLQDELKYEQDNLSKIKNSLDEKKKILISKLREKKTEKTEVNDNLKELKPKEKDSEKQQKKKLTKPKDLKKEQKDFEDELKTISIQLDDLKQEEKKLNEQEKDFQEKENKLTAQKERLEMKWKAKNVNPNQLSQDILCVQIAALCYNLGHGPFSYVFKDKIMPDKTGETWPHEVASVWLFLDIVKDKQLNEHLNEKDLIFIKELIEGIDTSVPEWPAKGRTEDKAFLYEIVLNKWNNIDVRKWDYFARDCYYLGISNGFDYERLLNSARVCEVNGREHICFRDKVAENINDMFHTRYVLYRQAYMHKTVKIIEDRIADALVDDIDIVFTTIEKTNLETDVECKISALIDGEHRNPSESIKKEMEKIVKLTDHKFEEMMFSSDIKWKDAKKTIKSIVKRRLPKFLGETKLPETEFKDKTLLQEILMESWKEMVKNWINGMDHLKGLSEKCIVAVTRLDYKKEDTNPIDNVYFFEKNNIKARRIKKKEVSKLRPEKFTEDLVRIYYRITLEETDDDDVDVDDDDEYMLVKTLVVCFEQWCNALKFPLCVIEIYTQENFKGIRRLLIDSCHSLRTQLDLNNICSCKVVRGVWKLFNNPEYTGTWCLVEKGEYPTPAEWGSGIYDVQSLECVGLCQCRH